MAGEVSFDITLKGAVPGAPAGPTTLDDLRPPPEAIERCVRWLASKGVSAHPTAFGAACSCPPDLFEALFGVAVESGGAGRGGPSYVANGEPTPPAEIADIVESITLTGAPELF